MDNIRTKKRARFIAIAVAFAVAVTCITFVTAQPADAASKYIGKTKALNVSLKHAKLKKSQVRDIDVDREYEKGRWIYEVDFERGTKEYKYDIHATSGKILKAPKAPKKTKYISSSKATSIALKNAKTTRSQVWDLDVEMDYLRGQRIYEVNFNKGSYEYDYDISATSGKILNKWTERDDDYYDGDHDDDHDYYDDDHDYDDHHDRDDHYYDD
jgi:uncharacterized membrane protein YkoI